LDICFLEFIISKVIRYFIFTVNNIFKSEINGIMILETDTYVVSKKLGKLVILLFNATHFIIKLIIIIFYHISQTVCAWELLHQD